MNERTSLGLGAKEVVLALLEAYGRGDFEAATALFADDATLWIPGRLPFSGTLTGKEAIYRENLLPSAQMSMPGSVSVEIGTVIAEGDRVAAEWVFSRITLDGRKYRNVFFALFEVEGGKVKSMREYLDTQYAMDMLWRDQTNER
ncbi:MAG TPA: nuclear transport factor 2 family protein [Allosphingosinicella sp.]|nr:nuclear transport factor 2 family protein [Allosphingosinicella sp.]